MNAHILHESACVWELSVYYRAYWTRIVHEAGLKHYSYVKTVVFALVLPN